mgnify:CR=1 FL=1
MKKLLSLVLVTAALLSNVGCTCTVEKKAVEELEKSLILIEKDHRAYVEADTKLPDPKDKADKTNLWLDTHTLLESLKKALK